MKTTRTVLLLLLSCMLLSSTCFKQFHCPRLQLDNKTDKNVFCHYSFDYPDTSMNFQNPQANQDIGSIWKNSKGFTSYPEICLEDYFKNYSIQKVSVFVFDAALVDTTPWEKIRQNYQVLKRFDLSQEDLINNNYVIELR